MIRAKYRRAVSRFSSEGYLVLLSSQNSVVRMMFEPLRHSATILFFFFSAILSESLLSNSELYIMNSDMSMSLWMYWTCFLVIVESDPTTMTPRSAGAIAGFSAAGFMAA